uniref:Uncharacterized protein n=1 Tax=Aegilops tauschii TaxID=37682 RepID=R7VZ65_AEGTA
MKQPEGEESSSLRPEHAAAGETSSSQSQAVVLTTRSDRELLNLASSAAKE